MNFTVIGRELWWTDGRVFVDDHLPIKCACRKSWLVIISTMLIQSHDSELPLWCSSGSEKPGESIAHESDAKLGGFSL